MSQPPEFRKLDAPYYCESGARAGRRQACPCVPEPEPCAECVEFAKKLRDLRRPWFDNDKIVPELNVGAWEYDVRVCVGTGNVVEIDKLYGPLVAQPVRVSIEKGSWVVEREVDSDEDDTRPGIRTWVVVARFPLDGEIPGVVQ